MSGQNKQPHEHKVFSFELKEVDLSASTFSGFSAAMGNRDLGNDIIAPGAFKKTIKERVSRRYIKLLDNHRSNSTQDVWGTVVEAEEVPFKGKGPNAPTHKLLTTFEVSQADENAQTALKKIAEKHLDQLSIGFRSLREEYEADEGTKEEDPRWAWMMGNGVRHIKEVQWWETSVVIWAMNPEAQILANSVTSLLDFAQKAVQSGVRVPDDAVRKTIAALQMLAGDDCPHDGVTDDVHAAVAEVMDAVKRVESLGGMAKDPADVLQALFAQYGEKHGDPTVEHFTVWVSDTLTPDEDETKDAPSEDEDTDVAPIEEPADADAPAENEDAEPEPEQPVEVPEDPVDDTMSLTAAVQSLADSAAKLANTLATDDAAEVAQLEEVADDVSADHSEEEEAAKSTDVEDDADHLEHFPDGDALALAAAELGLLEIELAAA